MTSNPIDVSIIIPCKNEGKNLVSTIDSMLKSKNSLKYEIIVVDNGSVDHCTDFLELATENNPYCNIRLIKSNAPSVGTVKNSGAKVANGHYLFFCDGHVEVPNFWLDRLVNSLLISKAQIAAPSIVNMQNSAAVGYGMTWNSQLSILWQCFKPTSITETPIVCGCVFGIEKAIFERIYGFDKLFIGYGVEDQEICLKAWLYGYKVIINPEVNVKHLFRSVHPYTILPTNEVYNLLCLGYYHFKFERLEKLIKLLRRYNVYSDAASNIVANLDSILGTRDKYFNERMYNDDYFFEKFNLDF